MPTHAASRYPLAAALLAALGYGLAAGNSAGLSWDGSWYLFRSLQDGTPFIPHLRYGTYPILWVVVQAAKVIHNPATLGVLYGSLLTLFPLGALALSWWYLRGAARRKLRVWPALGILIASLPGQFCLMSEATPAAQLMWPILAIITAGPIAPGGALWLIALSAALLFLHPTSALIFALAAGLLGWRSWTHPGSGKAGWIWAGGFSTLALGAIILTLFTASEYERSQATWWQVWSQFEHSILGFPLLLLSVMYLFGLWLLTPNGTIYALLPPRVARAVYLTAAVLVAVAGMRWAHDPTRWSGLLDYRRFVLPAMLPLVAMAAWHRRAPANARRSPAWLLPGISALFCLVLVTQAVAWKGLLDRFARQVASRPPPEKFVPACELPFTAHTALRHWTACPLSILLQDRQPSAIFVLQPTDAGADAVQVNAWEQLPLVDGWFTLHQLRRTSAEKTPAGALPPAPPALPPPATPE